METPTQVKEAVIVILLIQRLSINANNLSPTLQQAISSYCPYTDLCQSPARLTTNGNERTSCCAQCSCDNDCWRLDNCCPDKDRSKIHNTRALPCKSTLTKDFINDNGIRSIIEPRTYRIEDICPASEVNKTLIEKCQGYIKDNLEDYVLVSDKQTGMIYQNRHCAECHGVTEYTQWSIRTSCYQLLSQERSFETTLISDRCDIVNEVPSSEKARAESFTCFIPIYSECNMTGLWEKYDSDIVAACNQYNWTYFQIKQMANRVETYKNVFCFLCNTPANVEIPSDHCIDIDGYLFLNQRTQFRSLTILLDMNTYLGTTTRHSTVCQMDELWDSYMVSMHARIQRGDRGPPPPLKNHKKYRVYYQYCCGFPEKSQSYQGNIQCWAIIGPPAKRQCK